MNIKLLLPLLAALVIPSMLLAADEKPATATTVVKRIGVDEYDKLRSNNSPRFPEMIGTLDKKKAYLVNCAVGMRSAKACKKLEGAGFKELYDLAPGFDGWRKAGKPVQK